MLLTQKLKSDFPDNKGNVEDQPTKDKDGGIKKLYPRILYDRCNHKVGRDEQDNHWDEGWHLGKTEKVNHESSNTGQWCSGNQKQSKNKTWKLICDVNASKNVDIK